MNLIQNSICFMVFHLIFSVNLKAQDSAEDIFNKAKDQMLTSNVSMVLNIVSTDNKGREKDKELEVWLATFGNTDKTRVQYLKPERAKGTTIIISDVQHETGVIEVFTPSNGKIRKLKASEANLKMVGSEFSMTNFTAKDTKALTFILLGQEDVHGKPCSHITVKDNEMNGEARGELWIDTKTYQMVQLKVYNEENENTRLVQFSEYKIVEGINGKIQPMHIFTNDFENTTTSDVHILSIQYRPNFTEADFTLTEVEIVD